MKSGVAEARLVEELLNRFDCLTVCEDEPCSRQVFADAYSGILRKRAAYGDAADQRAHDARHSHFIEVGMHKLHVEHFGWLEILKYDLDDRLAPEFSFLNKLALCGFHSGVAIRFIRL